jgi:hypothetical protein
LLALGGCGGADEPERQASKVRTPAPSSPGTPPPATGDTGDLVVCARVAPLIARINGQFNALTATASQRRRTAVARSFDQAHLQIRTIIAQAGLDPASAVRVRGLVVAAQTARVAHLLRAGAAVGYAGLQTAQRQLGVACKK